MYPALGLEGSIRMADDGSLQYKVEWEPSYVGLLGLSPVMRLNAKDLTIRQFGEAIWEQQVKELGIVGPDI